MGTFLLIIVQVLAVVVTYAAIRVGWRVSLRGLSHSSTFEVPDGFESVEDYDSFLDHYASEWSYEEDPYYP